MQTHGRAAHAPAGNSRGRCPCLGAKFGFRVVIARGQRVIRGMKVAFISGTSIVNSTLFSSWDVKTVETQYGPVTYKSRGEQVLINRHGYALPLPPHSINHRANIAADHDAYDAATGLLNCDQTNVGRLDHSVRSMRCRSLTNGLYKTQCSSCQFAHVAISLVAS